MPYSKPRVLLPGVVPGRAVLAVLLASGVLCPRPAPARAAAAESLVLANADAMEPVNAESWSRLENVALKPMRVVAPRNGVGSAQVVVECVGCRVSGVGEITLRSEDGAELAGENLHIRYALQEDGPYCDTLVDEPPADARVLPVWLIADVPREQAPGKYCGKLTIRAGEQAHDLPVELYVCAWTAPDPTNNVSHVSLLHSPDTLALRYGVTPWSEAHFALIEKSLELMGQAGNDVLYVPVVRYTHLGNNNGMIRWVARKTSEATGSWQAESLPEQSPAQSAGANGSERNALEPGLDEGGPMVQARPNRAPDLVVSNRYPGASPLAGMRQAFSLRSLESTAWIPDLSVFERFLDLYAKHCGPPKVLCLEVWNHRIRNGEAPVVTLCDPSTGALSEMTAPAHGAEGSVAFWKPMMDAVRASVMRRGWIERCLMLGVAADRWPSQETVEFFRGIAPYARWAIYTHGRWKGTREDDEAGRMVVANGMEIGYHEDPWGYGDSKLVGETDFKPWRRPYVKAGSLRECISEWAHPVRFRNLADIAVNKGNQGFGRVGLDYWPLDGEPLIGLYENKGWDRLYADNPRAVAAPGPDGALPTVRFQMLREGVQEAEARIVIAAALERHEDEGSLGADLARRCRALLEERLAAREAAKDDPSARIAHDWPGLTARLYELAGEVAAATQAADQKMTTKSTEGT